MPKEYQADIVIVGASHAGGEVAARVRQGGFAGSIALLGAEPHLPYQRPPALQSLSGGRDHARATHDPLQRCL